MASLTKQELEGLHPDRIPLSKVICVVTAAFHLLTCVEGAGGDLNKIKDCVETFVAAVKRC